MGTKVTAITLKSLLELKLREYSFNSSYILFLIKSTSFCFDFFTKEYTTILCYFDI